MDINEVHKGSADIRLTTEELQRAAASLIMYAQAAKSPTEARKAAISAQEMSSLALITDKQDPPMDSQPASKPKLALVHGMSGGARLDDTVPASVVERLGEALFPHRLKPRNSRPKSIK